MKNKNMPLIMQKLINCKRHIIVSFKTKLQLLFAFDNNFLLEVLFSFYTKNIWSLKTELFVFINLNYRDLIINYFVKM